MLLGGLPLPLGEGGVKGWGEEEDEDLSAQGMRLVLVARSQNLLEELSVSLPTECLVQAVDLRYPTSPTEIISNTIDHFGRLDVLVNNSGATKRADFLALSDDDWGDGFSLKFFGAVRSCRAAWQSLLPGGLPLPLGEGRVRGAHCQRLIYHRWFSQHSLPQFDQVFGGKGRKGWGASKRNQPRLDCH